jgi:pimeloyl-ACP methyl ester carboxylesterase
MITRCLAAFLLLHMVFLQSCYTDLVIDGRMEKYAFVDVGSAVLPVLVAGKVNSDAAVIFVHGGPGNSGMLFRKDKGLYDLEEHCKVVYYDQRASGLTQGNSPPGDITIEQFSEDLDVIVDFTREVIGAKSIFIIGHSWGGGLSTYYLLKEEHQAKVSGYIAVAPAFNVVKAMENSRTGMLAVATALVNLDIRTRFWQGAIDFYNEHPRITQDVFGDHLAYVEEAKGVNFSRPQEVSVGLPDYQVQAYVQNVMYANSHMTIGGLSIFDAMELDGYMADITLPTFLIWGEKDGLIPVAQSADFYEAIGTPEGQFYYLGFPVSAHEPMAEEPAVFTSKVVEFIELYR